MDMRARKRDIDPVNHNRRLTFNLISGSLDSRHRLIDVHNSSTPDTIRMHKPFSKHIQFAELILLSNRNAHLRSSYIKTNSYIGFPH